ncbi:hypothetical protein [Pedobacter punctiformis]|uniref:Glycosyl transferase family 1 domain-containing protein n=1 Tax=Pedobacter punctiformis TaxID=3004097 RepID=A0ABT4L9W2_9SPHI|nr:hypothetical protein [Pedobacter sp. HCMS5-2]MCZ4244708.1 hypothetical protein [Pedobacter sp. HCMS5-2]
MKIVAAVYSHPEYYPPTLNAINVLSNHVEKIEVISRNVKENEIVFPGNVKLKKSGDFKKIRETETAGYFWKLKSFILFSIKFYQSISKTSPEWVIVYDPIPLLSYQLFRRFLRCKPKLWYHNHDVLDMIKIKKYSISWFAKKAEQNSFNQLNVFSLPSEERKQYFPLDKFNGEYFFLPNYPSLASGFKRNYIKAPSSLKLIYQGHIGEGHGLIEIIKYLKNQKTGLNISLTLIGNRDNHFENILLNLIRELDLSDVVKIMSPVPYFNLKEITALHDIGLAIHEPVNLAFNTAATSSNKIYEYSALGLPVLLYDNIAYRKKLDRRAWAFFTDLTENSLEKNILAINGQYFNLSKSAIEDFSRDLNFENNFSKILSYLLTKK